MIVSQLALTLNILTETKCRVRRGSTRIYLPVLQKHARFALRHIPCPVTRSDLIAEIVALAWKHFLSLVQRGKDPSTFFTMLAMLCSQAVRSGRRLAGSERSKDVLSPIARIRHGFTVGALEDPPRKDDALADALAENSQSEVPDQAAFRIDFPRWRRRFGTRTGKVLDAGSSASEGVETCGFR